MSLASFTKTTTKTFTPLWVRSGYMQYSERFKEIRSKMTNKSTHCFKCRTPFDFGDSVALACFKECGNEVLCEKCAKEMNKDAN